MSCVEGVRPICELRGFKKVSLNPGESAEVAFELSDAVLGYTDRSGNLRCDKPAEYTVRIAPNSASGKAVPLQWK